MSTNGNAIRADNFTGGILLGSQKKVTTGQRLWEFMTWPRSVHFFRNPGHPNYVYRVGGGAKYLTK